jgi:amidase
MKHLRILSSIACALALASPSQAATFNLETASVADIQAAMAAGALSSEQLVSMYLKRIEAYDKKGPKVNAVITINPNALAEARALDVERKATGPRGPLHGVPVVFKDLIDVTGLPTTAGFTGFGAPVPQRDATIVARMRDAGMVMLAKVSTTNWFGRGFEDTHPIGVSLNPYNLDHSPGGSSNGSGVAIAANFSPLAIGTDTSVSVQSPSASTSTVGMVGTYGMVSRSGIVPRGATQDRPGPMGKSVADVAALFSVMSGWDAEDFTTFSAMGHFPSGNWADLLPGKSLEGMRIGIPIEMIPQGAEHAEVLAMLDKAVEQMRAAGAFVTPILFGNPRISIDTAQANLRTAEYEKIPYTDAYLKRLGSAAVYTSTKEMMDAVGHEKFSESMTRALTLPPPETSADYLGRYRTRAMYIELISRKMDEFQLDVLIQPFSMRPPPALSGSSGWSRTDGDYGPNNLSSSLGLPAVVVPAGFTKDKNLPIAIQFVGKPYTDLKVVEAAYGYEQISLNRVPATSTPPLAGEVIRY